MRTRACTHAPDTPYPKLDFVLLPLCLSFSSSSLAEEQEKGGDGVAGLFI